MRTATKTTVHRRDESTSLNFNVRFTNRNAGAAFLLREFGVFVSSLPLPIRIHASPCRHTKYRPFYVCRVCGWRRRAGWNNQCGKPPRLPMATCVCMPSYLPSYTLAFINALIEKCLQCDAKKQILLYVHNTIYIYVHIFWIYVQPPPHTNSGAVKAHNI